MRIHDWTSLTTCRIGDHCDLYGHRDIFEHCVKTSKECVEKCSETSRKCEVDSVKASVYLGKLTSTI